MFFTHDVLVNTGGKFATIWLAAMMKGKIKKKDYLSVQLEETCNELLKHFKPRSDGRMGSVKGFSLRLSAQLVYGVMVVYNMKVATLYSDVQHSLQILRRFRMTPIYPAPTSDDTPGPAPQRAPAPLPSDEAPYIEVPLTVDPLYGGISSGFLGGMEGDMMVGTSGGSPQQMDSALIDDRFVVRDIASITLQEQPPHIADDPMLFDDFHNVNIDGLFTSDDLELFPSFDARANVTTPTTRQHVSTPRRPVKAPERTNNEDQSILAAPLLQDAPEQTVDAPRQSVSAPEQSVDAPRQSVDALEQSVDAPEQLIDAPLLQDAHEQLIPPFEQLVPDQIIEDQTIPGFEPQADTSRAEATSSDQATSSAHSPIVLDPVEPRVVSPRRERTRNTRVIIDRVVAIPSNLLRDNLRGGVISREEFDDRARVQATFPPPLPTATQLSQHACKTWIPPTRQHLFMPRRFCRQYFDKVRNVADVLFEETILGMQDSQLRGIPVQVDESVEAPRVPDTTLLGDDGLNESERSNWLQTSAQDATMNQLPGENISDVFQLEPEMQQTSDPVDQSVPSVDPIFSLDHGAPIDPVLRTSSKERTMRLITSAGEGVISFETIAPPFITIRRQAVRIFSDVLRLSKEGKLLLQQDEAYSDFSISVVATGFGSDT
uniref:Uncharacterized LOC100176076 n=1 Tax=Ciona intestinalis TaxID=7719 RepID=F6YVI2_CIOIN|nr:uncharacterized protein LOC100176076 [Ciona intestinalis]|eukprot:XP_002124317.2 uncharacterized protein LOC100176076 [Ciona intestinalis]